MLYRQYSSISYILPIFVYIRLYSSISSILSNLFIFVVLSMFVNVIYICSACPLIMQNNSHPRKNTIILPIVNMTHQTIIPCKGTTFPGYTQYPYIFFTRNALKSNKNTLYRRLLFCTHPPHSVPNAPFWVNCCLMR